MKNNVQEVLVQFVDYLMPSLNPYEVTMYLFLLRNTYLKSTKSVRIGKRTIALNFAKGSRGEKTSYKQVTTLVKGLESKGCVKIGDTNYYGTLYTVLLPQDIPVVKEKLSVNKVVTEEDFFIDPKKRKEIFERDKWFCFYCGEKVTSENATLDHLDPQFKGGKNTRENLKTCCLICNSIKSGKTQEEAAPFILKSIQERRLKVL